MRRVPEEDAALLVAGQPGSSLDHTRIKPRLHLYKMVEEDMELQRRPVHDLSKTCPRPVYNLSASCPRTAFKLPACCPNPAQVMIDQGSQLIASDNTVKFDSLNWEQVEGCLGGMDSSSHV